MARLIETSGVQAVSVRAVVAALGYRPSTLCYYFPSSEEKLAYALLLVRQRQQKRLDAKSWPVGPGAALRERWLEAPPIDEERRTEAHVWLAANVTARSGEA